MKYITQFFKLFQTTKPLPLGRWQINHGKKYLDHNKAILASYDHCGSCGNIQKFKNNKYLHKRPYKTQKR